MVDISKFKKAELYAASQKLGLDTLTKDTKKVLVEKLEAFIRETGEEGTQLVEASLDIDTDDEAAHDGDDSTLADDTKGAPKGDDDDEEYTKPPIDVKEKLIDPVIDFSERYYAKFLEFTDRIGATTLDYNEELRENLSGTITLNFVELGLELVFFLVNFVPLVPVKHNNLFNVFRQYTEFFDSCSLPVPDITTLFSFRISSVFANWLLYALGLPLVISYYVNFTRRIIVADDDSGVVVRIYKYDPFIFALAKVLIFYFVSTNSGTLTALTSFSGIAKALKTHFLIQLGLFKDFTNELGTFPLVLGVANVAVGLYSQFEDY